MHFNGPLAGNLHKEGAKIIRWRNFRYSAIYKRSTVCKHEELVTLQKPAIDYDKAERHIHAALEALDVDSLDMMLLHAARAGEDVFEERAGAFQCLCDYKEKGLIKAVGVSTHHVGTVRVAGSRDDVDVIHPLINMAGTGILGGTVEDMASAIETASLNGKGIYAMKALGGGSLIDKMEEALKFVMNLPGIDSLVVGMVSEAEVEMNYRFFSGEPIPLDEQEAARREKRLKIVEAYCKGCGLCIDTCPNGALSMANGKSSVDPDKCLLCGYCTPACPEFAIRVI